MRLHRNVPGLIAVLTVIAQLAACGGGGGSGSSSGSSSGGSSAPPAPTATQISQAANAKLRAVALSGTTTNLRLEWDDTVNESTGYSVERMSGGTWSQIAIVGRPTGMTTMATWTGSVTLPATMRVQAMLPSYSIALSTATAQALIDQQALTTAPTIVFNQPEPVHDSVAVSIANSTGTLIGYKVDGVDVPASPAVPGYGPALNFETTVPGAHIVSALLQLSASQFIEVQRSVQVTGNHIDFFDFHRPPVRRGTTIYLSTDADSDFGMQKIEGFLDGVLIGTATGRTSVIGGNQFEFSFDSSVFHSGHHEFLAVATSSNGTKAHQLSAFELINPPRLTVTTPQDNRIVTGTLHIGGSMASDRAGANLRLRVRLDDADDDELVVDTTANPFSVDVNIATLVPGRHRVHITADDQILGEPGELPDRGSQSLFFYVASSTALVYETWADLGIDTDVLAVDTELDQILYLRGRFLLAHLRRYFVRTADSEREIPLPAGARADSWLLANGHAFANAFPPPDQLQFTVTYHFTPDGQVHEVTSPTGASARAVQWPWLVYADQRGNHFYNVLTGVTVTPPLLDPGSVTFFEDAGHLVVFYASGAQGSSGVRRWDQASGLDSPVPTSQDGWDVKTDGIHVAWRDGPGLKAMDVSTGVQTELTQVFWASTNSLTVGDGLIAWQEYIPSPTSYATRLFDGTTTSLLSQRGSSNIYGITAGRALYREDEAVYARTPNGQPQLLFEGFAPQVFPVHDVAFLVVGDSNKTVFRIPLN